MAHANIFERITTNDKKEASTMNKKALETIKLLGEQVIEIRKIIQQKDEAITALKSEISALRSSQDDTNANIKLLRIDQADLNKQLRSVKNKFVAHESSAALSPELKEFSQRVVERYEPQSIEQVMSSSKIKPAPISQMAKDAVVKEAKHAYEMNDAYHTISEAINDARTKLGLAPHEDLPGTIQEQNRVYSQIKNQAEPRVAKTGKEFTFGRIPRLLDL